MTGVLRGVAGRVGRLFAGADRHEPPRPCGGPDEIGLYLDRREAAGAPPVVDARTAADLDFEELFGRVDRCASAVGQQWLRARLRTPLRHGGDLEAFDALVEAVGAPGVPRDSLRRSLARLTGASSYLLPYLLYGDLPERPAAYRLTPVLTAAAVLAIAASFAFGVPGSSLSSAFAPSTSSSASRSGGRSRPRSDRSPRSAPC